MPPQCSICSYQQARPETPMPVYHRHSSSRQIRKMMGVEHDRSNPAYFCPTCKTSHPAKPSSDLNICVSSSTLHDFHFPREEGVSCPPDSSHVDWLTIPGAKIEDLRYAWRLDYHREPRPMRVLLVAGLNDLIHGGNKESIIQEIKSFKVTVDCQMSYHPGHQNKFIVAPILMAPKLVWFPDNGETPPGYNNRLVEVTALNDWIKEFNSKNYVDPPPWFQRYGVRKNTKVLEDGSKWEFQTHRWNEWRHSEARDDKLHLVDKLRVKMGQSVIKYFEGTMSRNHPLGNYW